MKTHAINPSEQTIIEAPLNKIESEELHAHENTIRAGLGTFFDVGHALAEIREKRLYRATHGSFEAYCREKWDMSRMHAHRLVAAAEVRDLLAEKRLPLPQTEAQVRALTSISKDRIPSIWASVIKSAGKKAVTARLVGAVLEDLYPDACIAGNRKAGKDENWQFLVATEVQRISRAIKSKDADGILSAVEKIKLLVEELVLLQLTQDEVAA